MKKFAILILPLLLVIAGPVDDDDRIALTAIFNLATACRPPSPLNFCSWTSRVTCLDSRVTELRLGDCGITALPEDIGRLTMLRELRLHGNHLTTLPSSIASLEHLEILSVPNNNITHLPRLPDSLKAVFLSSNNYAFTDNNDPLCQLRNVAYLNLFKNGLRSLPECMANLSRLLHLDLSSNKLESLPRIGSLRTVLLSGNEFREMPEAFLGSTSVRRIDLGENQISELPPWFGQLSLLEWLDLSNNRLTSFELGDQAHLADLDLSGNPGLATLPDLTRLAGLQKLVIKSTTLSALPALPESLRFLHLEDLPLSGNLSFCGPKIVAMTLKNLSISGIVARSDAFPVLTELDLSVNNLSDLSAFRNSSQLISVNISSNPHLGWNRTASMLPNWLLLRSLSAQSIGASSEIAEVFASLRHHTFLTHLDLSGNPLTGEISQLALSKSRVWLPFEFPFHELSLDFTGIAIIEPPVESFFPELRKLSFRNTTTLSTDLALCGWDALVEINAVGAFPAQTERVNWTCGAGDPVPAVAGNFTVGSFSCPKAILGGPRNAITVFADPHTYRFSLCSCVAGTVRSPLSGNCSSAICEHGKFWVSSVTPCRECLGSALGAAFLVFLALLLTVFAFTIVTFPRGRPLGWLVFDTTVQSVQLAALSTVHNPDSEIARSLAIFNLDLRNFWLPCLMTEQHVLSLVLRLLVPLGVVALTHAIPKTLQQRKTSKKVAATATYSVPLLMPASPPTPQRPTRPRSWTRVLWTFFLPVAAVSLDVFDCVDGSMRSIPTVKCANSNKEYQAMTVLAGAALLGHTILFPLHFLWVTLRKRAASTLLDPGDRWGSLRTRLWILLWHACRLAVAFVVFVHSQPSPKRNQEGMLVYGRLPYEPPVVISMMLFLLAVVTAGLRPWPREFAPLYTAFLAYLAVAAAGFFPAGTLGLDKGVYSFGAAVVFVAVAWAVWERDREVERRKERERLEILNEEDADLRFLMPLNILLKVLKPVHGHHNLLAATVPAGVALDDQTHPCYGLFRVIMGELTKPVTPAEVIPWAPVLTKVAVTYHHTLSKAFRQRLRLLADPSRAALRKPWETCLDERRAVSSRLEAHLSRLSSIVAALRYDDLESTHRVMTEMPSATRPVSSPMYGLSLAQEADSLVRCEPKLIMGLATAGLDLVWHGTSGGISAMENICRTGFADLSKLNVGWHGRGMYFTHWPQYADYYLLCGGHRPENLTPEGEHGLLLSWALIGTAYPVLERMDRVDDPEHIYHGGYPGHDSHFALVNDGGATCTQYLPNPRAKFDEVMIWQESQVLPLAIAFFKLQ